MQPFADVHTSQACSTHKGMHLCVWTHTYAPSPACSNPVTHRHPQTSAHTVSQSHVCCNTAPDGVSTLQALLNPAVWVSGGEECDWHPRASPKRLLRVAGERLQWETVTQHYPSPSTGHTARWKAEHQHAEGCLEFWMRCCSYFQSYWVQDTASPWTTELVWWPLQFAAATAYIINATVCARNWPCSQPGLRSINYAVWISPNWVNTKTE